jgi:GT2 family glycosyltransferase
VGDGEGWEAGRATLVAPAAVRVVDLDRPLVDCHLPRARDGRPYRSLLVIARLEGDPLGAATFSVGAGDVVPGSALEVGLLRAVAAGGAESERVLGRRWSPSSTSVSVVVTTCCNPRALERCLRSILACDYKDLEVIVVENRPGSGATRRMLGARFDDPPGLRYLEEPRAGLSRARNAGLASARGELVAFVDDDTIVDPSWIERLVERFEWPEEVDCVTGLILPLELETPSQLLLEQFAGFGKGFERRTYRLRETGDGTPVYPYAPGTIGSGANTALRRSVALELGGFDPALGAGTPAVGGEDIDLYLTLLLGGYAIAYEPSAIVWHQHPDGPERLRSQVYRYGMGLGATFTKQLLRGPARRQLVRAVPAGVRYAIDPGSRKNAAKARGYPRSLDRLERMGMLAGPVAYVVSAISDRLGQRPGRAPHPPTPFRHRVRLPHGRHVDLVSFDHGEAGRARAPRARGSVRGLGALAAVACVAAPLAVALGLPAPLKLPAVLGLICVAPGAALLTRLGGRLEPGLVLGASLACCVLGAEAMLWLDAWWPKAFLYLLAGVCLAVLLAGGPARGERNPRGSPFTARSHAPPIPADIRAHIAVIAVAITAWAASLTGADLNRMAGLGLLNAMPPTYFLAIALLLCGFVAAVTRPVLSQRLLGAYVLALVVVLHATTPLLYDQPRYTWTYTHLGVINFIAETGGVDRHVDIYNNWPGFFALNAWFSRATGVAPAAYAEWAQLFFNLANVAALRFALRGVTSDERLLWTATWLFLLGNWVAQDYLAPQALGFLLATIIIGLALRAELRWREPRTGAGIWFATQLARLRALLPHGRRVGEPRRASPLSPRGAVLVGGLCYLAVVTSHQLTPVMLLAGFTGLALADRRLPFWVPVAMALVEAGWVALAWPYLADHYALFDPDPASSAAPPGYKLGDGLPGLPLVGEATRVELLLFAALALAGLVRRLRARRWDLPAAILVAAPLLVVGLQSYGGEGRYRFYLFALPWLCFFAAAACAPSRFSRLRWPLRGWRLSLATGVLGVCFLFAFFGMELSNRIHSDDVKAAVWFERHAPPDSLLTGLSSSFPRRLSERYARAYDPAQPGAPGLTDRRGFRGRRLGRRDVPRIAAALRSYGNPRTFIALTPSQDRFNRLFGILPQGSSRHLARALRSSRSFRLVYARDGASIFRLLPSSKEPPS